MVQKAGVDVDKLLDLLVLNASAELTTFYYHTILRVMRNAQSQKDMQSSGQEHTFKHCQGR